MKVVRKFLGELLLGFAASLVLAAGALLFFLLGLGSLVGLAWAMGFDMPSRETFEYVVFGCTAITVLCVWLSALGRFIDAS